MSKADNQDYYAEVKSYKNRKPPRKVLHMIDGELTEPKVAKGWSSGKVMKHPIR